MAWNEPGGGKRDPWQNKPQPPDIEAWLKRLRDGVNRLFRGGGGKVGGGSGGIALIVLALIVAWLALDSWTVIDARQIGVVLRFGQFNRVMNSGLNLKWPAPVERVIRVDATTVKQVSDEVRVLTKDENIVLVDFNVQYQVTDAKKYLFGANQPDETLKQAAESAVRQVIGRSAMDTILSGHGSEVVGETKKLLQQTLDGYGVGLLVTEINFQKILPPPEVKEAFDDANNAGNNQQQFINEAQGYAAKVVPLARGEAARIRAEAEGYKAAHIATATGDAQRFSLIDAQYKAAPEVTRKRLYLETMQDVLGSNLKIVDAGSGKNLIYLPLDKLKAGLDAATAAAAASADSTKEKTAKGDSP
ncbi:MAG: FtsH protease activity modulator HflK [Rudaea sp.]